MALLFWAQAVHTRSLAPAAVTVEPQPGACRQALAFHAADSLREEDVAQLFAHIRALVLGHLRRRGILDEAERGRNLIPPTATGITLRRDLLDHYAT